MSDSNKSKTIDVFCDDARAIIAETLPEIASAFGEKAIGSKEKGKEREPSVAHAKFLLDMAEFLDLVKKKAKPAQEDTGNTEDPADSGVPSFSQFFVQELMRRKVNRADQPEPAIGAVK